MTTWLCACVLCACALGWHVTDAACPDPENVTNAIIVTTGPYNGGDIVTYYCTSDAIMSGVPSMLCVGNTNQWRGSPPTCETTTTAAPTTTTVKNYYELVSGVLVDEWVFILTVGIFSVLLIILMVMALLILCCYWRRYNNGTTIKTIERQPTVQSIVLMDIEKDGYSVTPNGSSRRSFEAY
ncbi:uncharacterized protein LOC106158045 [Lingula anatina]|uniref:Uncharacterized protein LOC106158045 n=1 Tax=Lingula anatina TaxID=7574 RepID=A0A1S3HTG5_LINAN|nr:uncharacterized protein LOC106158045 [Lingula anatina]|eukprot:XP_013389335.1 uncharacterized protein LOC106158045 [Lingula anatina]